MPRNGAGNYVLPQAAFQPGTKIASAAVNSDFQDIAAALTQSFSADGQTPFTGQMKIANGNSSNPGYAFNNDLTTGVYLAGVGNLGIAVAGTQIAAMTSSGITWTGNATWSGNASVAGTFGVGGLATFGNATVSGTFGTSGTVTMAGANVTNLLTVTGNINVGSSALVGTGSGSFQLGVNPTVQRLLSGSGTYTPTANMVRIRGRIKGGGGSGASTGGGGSTGGTTTFGTWTAIGGSGGAGAAGAGGAGGTGGSAGTGTLVSRFPGAGGGPGGVTSTTTGAPGGAGGGQGGAPGGNNNAGSANTGGGGSGTNGVAGSTNSGAGGGEGEEVIFWMTAAQVGASLSYSIGAGGSGGGGNGGSGYAIIEEFYL